MSAVNVAILRAPGTNCDLETAYAFERAGAITERVHLFRLEQEFEALKKFQIVCIPGGFSFGDDLGAGVVFASRLRMLADQLREFRQRDTLMLGICNGFQVLLKSGLLPEGGEWSDEPRQSTLTWNTNGRYTALWVKLKTGSSRNVFLSGIDEVELPLAHAEGRIMASSDQLPNQWNDEEQIALRYIAKSDVRGTQADAAGVLPYPDNPNGSVDNIAGLNDPEGKVFGLMPHPERFLFRTQHPNWTRRTESDGEDGDGLKVFQNAVNYFSA